MSQDPDEPVWPTADSLNLRIFWNGGRDDTDGDMSISLGM